MQVFELLETFWPCGTGAAPLKQTPVTQKLIFATFADGNFSPLFAKPSVRHNWIIKQPSNVQMR